MITAVIESTILRPSAARVLRPPTTGPVVDFADYSPPEGGIGDAGGLFIQALTAAAGGTLIVPAGVYKIYNCVVPKHTIVRGAGRGPTTLLLSDGAFIQTGGDHITVGDLKIQHGAVPSTKTFLVGSGTGLNFLNLEIDGGGLALYPPHGFTFSTARTALYDGITIDNCILHSLDFGLLQDNTFTGSLLNTIVRNSEFYNNKADDLAFNTPGGRTVGLKVINNIFRDNISAVQSGGFAISCANTGFFEIADNTFDNYGVEAIHLEDGTERGLVHNNHIARCGQTLIWTFNSCISVMYSVRDVEIFDNYMDYGDLIGNNTLATVAIYYGPGGSYPPPYRTTVRDNGIFWPASAPEGWVLQFWPDIVTQSGNLAVGPTGPRVITSPRAATALVGTTATFSVTTTDAATVQWMRNGIDITGATSATYTTPEATLGDHGATFKARVGDSVETIFSAGATLTVTGGS